MHSLKFILPTLSISSPFTSSINNTTVSPSLWQKFNSIYGLGNDPDYSKMSLEELEQMQGYVCKGFSKFCFRRNPRYDAIENAIREKINSTEPFDNQDQVEAKNKSLEKNVTEPKEIQADLDSQENEERSTVTGLQSESAQASNSSAPKPELDLMIKSDPPEGKNNGWGQAKAYGTTLLGGASALTLSKLAYDRYQARMVQPTPAPEPSVRGGRTSAAPKRLAWLWIVYSVLGIVVLGGAALAVFFRSRM